jgi:endonuclease/exonuclease/phosphatase (EEP) superfamily protein YafD
VELITNVVRAAAALLWAFTLLGFLARWLWIGELACHFRRQYVYGFVFAACWLTVALSPAAWLCVIGAAVNLAPIIGWPRPPARARGGRKGGTPRTFRVLSANVLVSNRAFDRFRDAVRRTDPDLIVLLEINRAWLPTLRELVGGYPHWKTLIYPFGYGIGFFSRVPFERAAISGIGRVMLPSVIARLRLGSEGMTFIGIHPFSPQTPRKTVVRNRQFEELARFVAEQPRPLMIAGDFNTSPWSHAFRKFVRATGLRDSRSGFGVQPTWDARMPSLLRIPIDHCLVSDGITVHRRSVGPSINSDHLPVLVEFSVS